MSMFDCDQVFVYLKLLFLLFVVIVDLFVFFVDEDVDVGSIVYQIVYDQGLMVCVLCVVNLFFYGLQNKVGIINEVVVVFGFWVVCSMVLVVGINGLFCVD